MVVEAGDRDEEINETAVMAAMGELAMAKMAGEISDEEFEKEALSIEGLVQGAKGLGKKVYTGDIGEKVKEVKRGFGRSFRGTDVKNLKNARGELQASVKKELNDLKARGIDPSGPEASRATFMTRGAKDIEAGLKDALRKERFKTWGARGAVGAAGAAAAGGAGLGGKALYDKYNQ
jgi:hypothetical protein